MTEYIYRGFVISYSVKGNHESNSYKADGSVIYLLSKPKTFVPVKFHTEHDSYAGAEHEIKKLLENYVDFELKNYYQMQSEKA